jgi:hypothetical protein
MTTGVKNKRAIISFANKKGYYMDRMSRLSNSLRNNFDGDFLGFVHESSLGCELHENNPYSFKIAAFEQARKQGYTSILWLDSSVFAVAPVEPIFERLEQQGLVFQDAGHWLGEWSNDNCLSYFLLTRDKAMDLRMIGNAGFLGLDFNNYKANLFFDRWQAACSSGLFKGEWNNNELTESKDDRVRGHRHDMSCSSAIVHQLGIFDLAYKGDEVLQYAGIYDKVLNDTIILKAQG